MRPCSNVYYCSGVPGTYDKRRVKHNVISSQINVIGRLLRHVRVDVPTTIDGILFLIVGRWNDSSCVVAVDIIGGIASDAACVVGEKKTRITYHNIYVKHPYHRFGEGIARNIRPSHSRTSAGCTAYACAKCTTAVVLPTRVSKR